MAKMQWFKKRRYLKLALNLWPSYLFSGISVVEISPNFKRIHVQLKKRFLNSNYVGTHFGGNLYAMVDPFYMLMIIKNLGKRYYVWDIEASIQFVHPGKNRVHAIMSISDEDIEDIKQNTLHGKKYIKTFHTQVLSDDNQIICNVEKKIYIRLKPQYR